MFGIPFLLQHLLETYGLRGATLLGSCLWLSVGLAGALFGKGVTSIEEDNIDIIADESVIGKAENELEHPIMTRHRSNSWSSGLIYGRRTSFLPTSAHYHPYQQHKRLSSHHKQHYNSDKLIVHQTTMYEGSISNPRDKSRRYEKFFNRM